MQSLCADCDCDCMCMELSVGVSLSVYASLSLTVRVSVHGVHELLREPQHGSLGMTLGVSQCESVYERECAVRVSRSVTHLAGRIQLGMHGLEMEQLEG